MFKVVKDLMDFLKDRKTNSDLLYQWLACAAAMLTIAAYVRHQRPSEVLAEVTRVWGLDSASAWFTTGLPPVLALPNQTAQQIVLLIAEILVMAMLLLPFRVARQEGRPVGWQAQGLLGARAPSTIWILLMVASQLGPLNWFAIRQFSGGVLLFVTVLIIAGLLCLNARLFRFRNPLASGFQKLSSIVCDAIKILSVATLSFGLAVIAPLVGKFFWAASIESDSFFEAKLRLAREESERRRPVGAKPSSVGERD